MLERLDQVRQYAIEAKDGKIGSVSDIYFDEREWLIRYFVVLTGSWLLGRNVLLSPNVFKIRRDAEPRLTTELSQDMIRHSPSWNSHKPVSRQHEARLSEYYGWENYWVAGTPAGPQSVSLVVPPQEEREKEQDPYLHSSKEVSHCGIESLNDSIGHVSDFIVDTKKWTIRYVIIDTGNWLPGKKVLISTDWIEGISWESKKVFVGLEKEKIKHSPVYDPDQLDAVYEENLYRHYGRSYEGGDINRKRKSA